jgi:hypothetical protein
MLGIDLFIAVVVVFSIVLTIFLLTMGERIRRDDELEVGRVWASYARKKGLSYVAPEGEWPLRSTPRLVSDDLQIVLIRDGDARITRLEIRPRDSMLGRLIVTTHDDVADLPCVKLKDDMLDPAFRVFATPASLAETVLSREVARAISSFRMGRALRVEYERGRVVLEWQAGELNDARLDEARKLAETLGRSLSQAFVAGASA